MKSKEQSKKSDLAWQRQGTTSHGVFDEEEPELRELCAP